MNTIQLPFKFSYFWIFFKFSISYCSLCMVSSLFASSIKLSVSRFFRYLFSLMSISRSMEFSKSDERDEEPFSLDKLRVVLFKKFDRSTPGCSYFKIVSIFVSHSNFVPKIKYKNLNYMCILLYSQKKYRPVDKKSLIKEVSLTFLRSIGKLILLPENKNNIIPYFELKKN